MIVLFYHLDTENGHIIVLSNNIRFLHVFKITDDEVPPPLNLKDWEIVDCPKSILMANIPANEEAVMVDWNEPRAVSASGQSFEVTKSHTPMSSFPWGGTDVVYTVRAADGRSEECRFTILITPGTGKCLFMKLSQMYPLPIHDYKGSLCKMQT